MSKTKKIDREFLLTDNSVNSYGFRLLTEGYLMDEYKKNPIGYDMHKRDTGVVVKWEDLRSDGKCVYGKPVINLSHPNGQRVLDDIENGFLNAASVGHLVVLEVSDDPDFKIAGQQGPTVTKWFNRECSLVDIPGNFNALKLYDKDEQEINLADFTQSKFNPMKQIALTVGQLALLNLKAESSEQDVNAALNDLAAKAAKVEGLQTQLSAKEQELNDFKITVAKSKTKDLLAPALAAGKITKEVHDQLEKDYAEKPEALEVVLKGLPAFKAVTETIGTTEAMSEKRVQDLVAKGWDALMDSGEIGELKAKAPEAYKQLFKSTFGTEPK